MPDHDEIFRAIHNHFFGGTFGDDVSVLRRNQGRQMIVDLIDSSTNGVQITIVFDPDEYNPEFLVSGPRSAAPVVRGHGTRFRFLDMHQMMMILHNYLVALRAEMGTVEGTVEDEDIIPVIPLPPLRKFRNESLFYVIEEAGYYDLGGVNDTYLTKGAHVLFEPENLDPDKDPQMWFPEDFKEEGWVEIDPPLPPLSEPRATVWEKLGDESGLSVEEWSTLEDLLTKPPLMPDSLRKAVRGDKS